MKGFDPQLLHKNLIILTGENYKEWAAKFSGLFSFLGLSSHIEFDLKCFDDPAWVESEHDIKQLMAEFAGPKFHPLIHQSRTVAIAWDKLKAICEVTKTSYELFVALDSFRFTQTTNYSEMKKSIEESEFLCDNLAMFKFQMGDEFHKKAKLVSSLPDAFCELKQLLIADFPNLDYETMKSKTLEYAKELARRQIDVQNKPFNVEKPNKPQSSEPIVQSPANEQAAREGLVTPSNNVLIVNSKSAQNFRELASNNGKTPAIQDIRYMSPEQLDKVLPVKPAEASSTTPPTSHRRNSESGDRPPKRRDSPRRSRNSERRHSRTNRDQSRSRKESRRSRNESTGNDIPDLSINQNKVNRDFKFPKTASIELFKTLQGFTSMADCNRALVNECSKVSVKKEIASN